MKGPLLVLAAIAGALAYFAFGYVKPTPAVVQPKLNPPPGVDPGAPPTGPLLALSDVTTWNPGTGNTIRAASYDGSDFQAVPFVPLKNYAGT